MALLAVEGFDDGLSALRWPVNATTPSVSYGKNGRGMRVGDNVGGTLVIQWTAFSSDDTITMGSWIYVDDDDSQNNELFGFTAENPLWTYYAVVVKRDTVSNRWVITDRTGTTYAASNSCHSQTWYYVELQYTSHQTAGAWELKVDGATVASASSRDTIWTWTGDAFALWGGIGTGNVDIMWVDDVYVLDSTGTSNNDFLGICKVETLLPDGNGNSSGMTGSDGNQVDNYLLVDNNTSIPPVTTEYVGSGTQGHKDTYAVDNLSGTKDVFGVQTSIYAQKDDTQAKFFRPVVRSGSTDYVGTSIALANGTWAPVDEIWEVDPDTSSAWTYTAVNAMEVGQEVRDS